eukprot:TRINITY_DN42440_c0_g1_i1.p1 TRINITY_DN42440_c0_g1~~TRINITY_DN42440_c0_g1_i1.p1  ORF type:complete len:605 (-),score=133.71 TRINITY_DN42440_c0_g1_i1:44-1828(-)
MATIHQQPLSADDEGSLELLQVETGSLHMPLLRTELPLEIDICLSRQHDELQDVLSRWLARHGGLRESFAGDEFAVPGSSQSVTKKERQAASSECMPSEPKDRPPDQVISEPKEEKLVMEETPAEVLKANAALPTSGRWDMSDRAVLDSIRKKSSAAPASEDPYRKRRRTSKKTEKSRLFQQLEARAQGGAGSWLDYARYRCSILQGTNAFTFFFGALIVLNAVAVGVEVDYNALNQTEDSGPVFLILQIVFTVCFVVELAVRMLALGTVFFTSAVDWRWNVFDLLVVISSLIDLVIALSPLEITNQGALVPIRILRIVRVVKIVRLIRLLQQLRTMILTLWHTLSALLWTFVLIMLIIFLFSIILTQAVTTHVLTPDGADAPYKGEMIRHWGTIGDSCFTLLKAMSNGVDWGAPSETLRHLNTTYFVLYIVYVCFMVFAVTNVVTGFFCEHAFEMASSDKEQMVQEQLRMKEMYIQNFKQMFAELDDDESGDVTLDELSTFMEDDTLQAYLSHLNISVGNAWEIFRLIDFDRGGSVSIDEFVTGLLTMKGPARNIDAKSISYELDSQRRVLTKFMCFVEAELGDIKTACKAKP